MMEKAEAYKIFGISFNTPMAVINRSYLQKSEYYIKQLEDLKDLSHLSAEQTKLSSKLNLLKEAYISLGGHTDKPIIQEEPEVRNKALKQTLDNLKKINNTVYQIILVIIFVFILILALRYLTKVSVKDENSSSNKTQDSLNTIKMLEVQISNLQKQKKFFQLRYENAESKLQIIAQETPFIISAISFQNVGENGNNLENGRVFTSEKAWHITPVLAIVKIANNWNGKIGIKYIAPNGTLGKYPASPKGFTLENDLSLDSSGVEIVQLKGLGYAKVSDFTEVGKYEVEIWWNNKILGKETFKIQE